MNSTRALFPHASLLQAIRALTIFSLSFLFLITVFTSDAQAAAHKTCARYVGHTKQKCLLAKRARHHGRHAAFARPQPASIVIDADTGKVLEAENADAPRYPASLTKMMTLYLTFEALHKGKLKLDETIPVSEHGASQPQTNIALQPGDRLAVKDAILSIVVRSANDAAVTLGEAMGGTESGFARKMTQKAKALGMKNTVFFNASGLPEPRQHTTARDMAILGLALKRDFPQYYPFFKTESFSYHGITYPTHNHVMMRYDGVDGIKTGYIRASGFNLVTSARRDGHNLVGVVLGGQSWRARDDKMIALLDKNFNRLVTYNSKQPRQMQIVRNGPPIPTMTDDDATEGQGDLNAEDVSAADQATSNDDAAPLTPAPKTKKPDAGTASASAPKLLPPGAKSVANEGKANGNNWGIQVGAYPSKSDAIKATTEALKIAPQELATSKISVSDRSISSHYRARIVNLSQANAQAACNTLVAKKQECFAFQY